MKKLPKSKLLPSVKLNQERRNGHLITNSVIGGQGAFAADLSRFDRPKKRMVDISFESDDRAHDIFDPYYTSEEETEAFNQQAF